MKKTSVLYALLCATALVAATPARAADTLRVGTPEATALPFNILEVGTQAGLFARYGIVVERQDFAGSAKLHPAMSADAIDLAMGSGSDFLFIVRGVSEKAVGMYQKLPNDLSIVARVDGPVKSLADLKGKKMGVAGPGGLGLWVAMSAGRTQGWAPDDVTYAYLGTMAGITAALVSSNVDAGVLDTGAAYRTEGEGRTKVLAPGGAVVDPFIAHPVFASDALIAKNPDALKRYLKALYETLAYVKTHKAETIAMTAARSGYTPDVASRTYDAVAPQFVTDGHFEPAALAATLNSLVDLGVVAKADMPGANTMINESFLP